jgi:hypothetical protein
MTNTDRFYQQYTRHYVLTRRPLAPPGQMVPTAFGNNSTTLGLMHNAATEMGTITYFVGNAGSFYIPPPATDAPYLYQPTTPGGALPRILIITDFHSHYENTARGIGSAMLREVLRIAETADCHYVGVQSGINHEAYSGLGFDLIHPVAETWCISVARLRSRLSPLRRFREAP